MKLFKRYIPKYKIYKLDRNRGMFPVVEIRSGKFKGVQFMFSPRVKMTEVDNHVSFRFEYFLLKQEDKCEQLDKVIHSIAKDVFETEQKKGGQWIPNS